DFEFSADVRRPGMLYARVIRPSGRNATFGGFTAAKAQALALPGVQTIDHIGNFVYVLSSDEGTAQLISLDMPYIVFWIPGPSLIDQSTLPTALKANVYVADDEVVVGDAAGALSGAAETANARYFTPFQMHAPMAGSAAVADYDGHALTVWSGTQG